MASASAHADIIVKGSRDVDYGHKLNLTTGRSGMILDLVVEAGNPAGSERLLPMLERHIGIWGRAPHQAAADGGFASRNNISQAKAWGVRDMAFHKKVGLSIEAMVKSRWVYRKLRNFRAGVEANISCLKRAYGLARCTWRGLNHFKTYVWSSVQSRPLHTPQAGTETRLFGQTLSQAGERRPMVVRGFRLASLFGRPPWRCVSAKTPEGDQAACTEPTSHGKRFEN